MTYFNDFLRLPVFTAPDVYVKVDCSTFLPLINPQGVGANSTTAAKNQYILQYDCKLKEFYELNLFTAASEIGRPVYSQGEHNIPPSNTVTTTLNKIEIPLHKAATHARQVINISLA